MASYYFYFLENRVFLTGSSSFQPIKPSGIFEQSHASIDSNKFVSLPQLVSYWFKLVNYPSLYYVPLQYPVSTGNTKNQRSQSAIS